MYVLQKKTLLNDALAFLTIIEYFTKKWRQNVTTDMTSEKSLCVKKHCTQLAYSISGLVNIHTGCLQVLRVPSCTCLSRNSVPRHNSCYRGVTVRTSCSIGT